MPCRPMIFLPEQVLFGSPFRMDMLLLRKLQWSQCFPGRI